MSNPMPPATPEQATCVTKIASLRSPEKMLRMAPSTSILDCAPLHCNSRHQCWLWCLNASKKVVCWWSLRPPSLHHGSRCELSILRWTALHHVLPLRAWEKEVVHECWMKPSGKNLLKRPTIKIATETNVYFTWFELKIGVECWRWWEKGFALKLSCPWSLSSHSSKHSWDH